MQTEAAPRIGSTPNIPELSPEMSQTLGAALAGYHNGSLFDGTDSGGSLQGYLTISVNGLDVADTVRFSL